MTVDKLTEAVTKTTGAMARTDPFLGFMLLFVVVLVGYYVWEQKTMNQQLIQIQLTTMEDRRDKTAAITRLADTNEATADIVAKANSIAIRTATNIESLVDVVRATAVENKESRRLVELQLNQSREAAQKSASAMEALKNHVIIRDSMTPGNKVPK